MEIPCYQAIRDGESVAAKLDLALWRLTGPDSERWLNGQVTNQVVGLPIGQTRRAAVCSAKGRMQGDLWIARDEEAYWLSAPATLRDSLGRRLDMYLIADDCELTDVTDDWQLWHVFNDHMAATAAASRASANPFRFGPTGADLWVPAADECHGLTATPGVSVAAETLRLEHGLPAWEAELDEKTLPPEAGYDRFGISYTKGCYVGQETIARIKSIGHVNRQLRCLLGPDQSIAPGDELTDGESRVGVVTSVGYSPAAESSIALAYVKRVAAEVGRRLIVEGRRWEITEAPLALEGVAA